MKELSMEEKAKRYEEALERAREINNEKCAQPFNVMTRVFPELKESEDEKIRKCVKYAIDKLFLKEKIVCDVHKDDVLAWLEKQGESDETKAKAFLINKGYPIDANGVFPTYEEMYNIIREGLEQQNEQNHADKVEPKFKVGDWITDGNSVLHITSMDSGFYQFEDSYDIKAIIDKKYHLWTIADAKDGDVLVSAGNQPFIYNGKYTDSTIGAYIGISYDGKELFIGEASNWTENKNVKPATKEQRDLLFQRMKKDGYEWNADEKVVNRVIIYESKIR